MMAGGWLLIVIILADGSRGGNAVAMSRMGTHAACETAGKAAVEMAAALQYSSRVQYRCTEG